jgi:hypothetical protein
VFLSDSNTYTFCVLMMIQCHWIHGCSTQRLIHCLFLIGQLRRRRGLTFLDCSVCSDVQVVSYYFSSLAAPFLHRTHLTAHKRSNYCCLGMNGVLGAALRSSSCLALRFARPLKKIAAVPMIDFRPEPLRFSLIITWSHWSMQECHQLACSMNPTSNSPRTNKE